MQKYKTFLIFIVLTAIWSSLFSTIKYFFWGDLSNSISPDLQVLSGYLSLGGVLAYLLGGAIAYTFLKKYLLFVFSFLTLIFVSIAYLFPIGNNFSLAFIISGIGLFYGLWVVLRTIITSIEIQKTGLEDTKVNGIINVVFIIFLIIGTIAGSKIFEKFAHNGFLIIIGLLVLSCIISLFLDYDKITLKSLFSDGFKNYKLEKTHKFKNALKEFFPAVIYILKNFSFIIILSSIIWAISTAVSQEAIEYSVESFSKTRSEAAYLLLYSSVGAILGNIISGFLSKYRWQSFFVLNLILAILIGIFPFFNSTFFEVGIIAFLVGLVFGSSTNLIDSFYLKQLGEQDKKEYGSSTYGLIFSIILFGTMFFSSIFGKNLGFNNLMWVLAGIIFLFNLIFYFRRKGK